MRAKPLPVDPHDPSRALHPTMERPTCPKCVSKAGTQFETGALLRVVATRPIAPPAVHERDYLCKKCGYRATALYVLARHEDDYLSDADIDAREMHRRAAGDRLRAMRRDKATR